MTSNTLAAQDREQWTRIPEPRRDHTIFTELDLPTPNRQRTASGAPGPDYWQQEVNYQIEVSLDPATRTVHGHERISYVNHSPEVLDYLWVHLEQDILRPDSIAKQTRGRSRRPSAQHDGVRLVEVSAAGTALEFKVYDTLGRIELPEALAANGGRFDFDVTWEIEVPERGSRRYGTLDVTKGTVWELAQWFPAVAVYDDVHGWNTLPYLGSGEF